MKILAAALAILVLIICGIAAEAQNDISFSNGYYYINGEKTFLKGVGYEVGAVPGQLPWEREFDEGLLRFDMERILSAGFNSIRTWAAFTEEELEVIDDYEIYVIMGIWIDPHGDFSNPSFVAEARDIVEEVMAYSQNFDNIVGYLIMNEPLPETVFSAGYDHTVQLWNELTGIIHDMHPGVPVSMANTPNGTYIDPLVFDFSAYNVYIYNPVTVNLSHGYAAYAEYLQQLRTDDGPLIYTEFGLSVSPEGPGSWGYGGNTLQEQQEGDLFMYRAAIDGGAAGAFMFNYSDGWWKSGNEYVHDPYPEEWFGLIEYQDLSDKYGQPRPIWDACANYNRAIITEPKNGRIYIHKVPVEIFAGGDVQAAQVTEDGNVVFNSIITGNYFADSIIFTGNAKDRTLIFKFFDAGYNLLKEESITVLTADGPVDMPVLTISTSIEEW
ncbi:MAG TPA: hypothetical protein VK994_03510, partial [Bacteroidales bacterium]|nr:hypothetical protein [Bacteroidales bacterium]